MDDKSQDLVARVGQLAQAMVEGVLRALDARKEFAGMPMQFGGCTTIPGDDGRSITMRVSVSVGERSAAKQ